MGHYEAANVYVIASEGEKMEKRTGNTFEEIMAKTIPNFVENIIDPRISVNPKLAKNNGNHSSEHHNATAESQRE